LREATSHKRPWIIKLIIVSIILGLSFLLNFNVAQVSQIIVVCGKYPAIFVQLFVPIMMLIFSFRIKKQKEVEYAQADSKI
jgi:hypothetical protein